MREMKDSGIEWIGQIPADWNIVQVRYLFKIGRGRVIAQTELQDDGIYPVFSSQTKDNGCLGYINTYDFDVPQLTWTTDGANAGTVFLRSGKHNCTNVCGTLQPLNSEIDLIFQKYALEHIAYYHKRADTNGFKIMNNEMADIRTILPPLEIQHRIADYLDRKCSQIDAIIARQQEVIEKLKAYKLSKINEIVVEVEGITAHLGYVANMKNGLNFNVVPDGKTLKFLGVGDFKDHYVLDSEEMFSDILVNDEITSEYMLQSGDIIFVRSNGSKELVGRAVMVENVTFPLSYSGFCIRFRNLRTDILNSKYLLYFFRSPYFRKQLEKYSQGSNITNINQVLLSQISIIIPPMEVQDEAIRRVEKLLEAINKLIKGKHEIVSALERYKKSLIYEVVTGKKEV